MTTIANSFAAKLAVAFVAIAMMISVAAPTQAAEDTDLQAQIDALMATINALQAQLGVSGGDSMTSSSDVCPYTWTRSLNMGDTGSDVMKLQAFLNSDAATQVAATGAGSAGNETEYYGPATGAAVAKFQEMYRAEILSPLGLVNSTTFFGNSTRAQANAVCVASTDDSDGDMDSEGGSDDDSNTDDSSTSTLGNGDGDITNLNETSADESNLREGENVGLMAFDFDVEGDVEVNRVDFFVSNTAAGAHSPDPEDYFAGASLWVDGDKVAEVDVVDWNEDAYAFTVVNNSTVDEYRIRFSGLSLVFADNANPEFQIAFEANNVIDTNDQGEVWGVDMQTDSIRFVDGQGFSDTTGSASIEDTFTIQTEEVADLDATKSSASPDATTLEVDNNDNSSEIAIFTLEIEETEGVDATINDMTFTASTTNIDVTTTVDEVILYVDGVEVGSDSPTSVGALLFENMDIAIAADDTIEIVAKMVFRQTADYTEGDSVYLAFTEITDASDANGNNENDFASYPYADVTSDTFILRSEGLALTAASITETETVAAFSGDTDTGTFIFAIEVESFGANFFMDEDAANVSYTLLVDGVAAPAASSTATLNISDADTAATADYKLTKGSANKSTLTLTVEAGSSVSGAVKVLVNSVAYSAADDATEELTVSATPSVDWTSNSLILN